MKYKAKHDAECISELQGKTACVVKDNGNGLTIKFPAWRFIDQDIYMSLDYSQAAYLKECLNQMEDL